jgi:general secretion pathway protein D
MVMPPESPVQPAEPATGSQLNQPLPVVPPVLTAAQQAEPGESGSAAPVVPAAAPPPVQESLTAPSPPAKGAWLAITAPNEAVAGKELTMTVQVGGVERLYSAPLFVNYDPALLEFIDSKEGTFLNHDGQTTVFSYSPNPATGQVVVGYKQGVGGGGASGDGSLFTLRFRSKAPGTARVELNRINFRDPAGTRLNIEPATASIVIR